MALRGAVMMGAVAAAMTIAAPALATTYDEIQVTTGTAGSLNPVVSNGRIAYLQRGELYLYDVATGVTQKLATVSGNDTLEDMDGNYVVYAHRISPTDTDLYGYDLSLSKEFTVASGAGRQTEPAISGSTVVWEDTSVDAGGDIDSATLSDGGGTPAASGTTQRVVGSTSDTSPRVAGNWMVWVRINGSGLGSVFAEDLTTATVVTVADAAGVDNVDADVDGNTVVYASGSLSQHDVWAFDLTTRVATQISSSTADERRPRISGTDVVWEDSRNQALNTCGPSANQNCGIDLYGQDLSALGSDVQLEHSAGDQYLQDVQGDDVAFTDTRTGTNEIYDLHRVSSTGTGSGDPCDPASGAPLLYSATYTRGHGQPQTVSATFASGVSSGTVCLSLTHVSSAEIDLNGASVFGPSDFNPNLTAAEASVNLGVSNTLDVTLRGKPCGGGCGGGDDGSGDDGDGEHTHRLDRDGQHHHGGGDDDVGEGHHHHGDDGDGDGSDGSNGSTCSTISLRVVGPIPAPVSTPPNTVGTFSCDVHGAAAGFDLRLMLPLLLGAGLVIARRRRA